MPPAEDAASFLVVEDESSAGGSPSFSGHSDSSGGSRQRGGGQYKNDITVSITPWLFGSLGDGWMAFFALCAFSMLFFQGLHHRQQLNIIMLGLERKLDHATKTAHQELIHRLDTLQNRVGEVETQFKDNLSACNIGKLRDPDKNELVHQTRLLELEHKVESLVQAVKHQQDKGIEDRSEEELSAIMESRLAEELSIHETKTRQELQVLNETHAAATEMHLQVMEQLSQVVKQQHQSMETRMDEGQNHTASLNARVQTLEDSLTKPKEPTHEQCIQPYKILNRADRNVKFVDKNVRYFDWDRHTSPDWQGNGWYRFMGEAGMRMPESPPPSQFHCGTVWPAWLDGSHPAVSDGIVERLVCERGPSSTCEYPGTIQVVNCGVFFLYNLEARVRRYCGV